MKPHTPQPRTLTQNASLWLWFTLLADELNSAGLDMKKVLKPNVDIPWSKDSIHDFIWIPIQKVLLKKDHSADLLKHEVSEVFDVLNRHLGERKKGKDWSISVPFPSQTDGQDWESMARGIPITKQIT